ncbi:hypothetical protein CHLRE_08g381075v5 [Chlamydomonas reinhardtii]|uniref:Uncharacterized protein n=1 Tax=Chlamydomonas reinhardtii TaxID=3055 RepID=A0A2K3DI12_CHLRE|nr:uncharacterized protein CHLRE_08g381075v5 [Chlamydomonas reinhardtii]PNW80173.1 hypothetical protein CHLRE_08g381075v5 [Chlamydomonas reinhardtii]
MQDAWRHTPRSQGHGSDESEPSAAAHQQEQQEPAPSACCFPHKSCMRWCYASLSAGCRSAPCQLCHAYDNHWRPQKPPGLPKVPKLAAPTKPAAAASPISTSTVDRSSTTPRWGDDDEDEADGLDLSDLFEQTPWVKQGLAELAAAEQQQAEAAPAAPAAASESDGSSSSIAPRASISSSGGASGSWADEVEAHEEAEEELDLGSLADWMKEGLAEQAAAAAVSGTGGTPSGRRWADDVEEEEEELDLGSLAHWMKEGLAEQAAAAWAEQERELEEFAALERACGCFPPPAAVAAW